jgi:uncharacterized membrane protein
MKDIKKTLTDTAFLFLTGAFIGWLYEVLLHVFKDGMFINRGMLHGPWLPIYGLGCLVMVWLKKVIGNRPISYFAVSMAACGVMEYTSSWLAETIYHVRWWDYSNCLFNLNGRIFLGGLLGFGAAGCLFVFVLLPLLTKQYNKVSEERKIQIAVLLLVIFFADLALSLLCPNMGFGITNY